MYIALTLTMPNSAEATVHRIGAIETQEGGAVVVRINSFVNLAAAVVLWQEQYEIPPAVLATGIYPENVYDWLVGVDGPLEGGTVVDDTAANLAAAQLLKWIEIKNLRNSLEFGGCETAKGIVDTDETSQQRISSTLVFSNIVGFSFYVGWTMADESVVGHDRAEFIDLALLVGQHVSNAHSRAQSLRQTVYDLATIGEVEAFDVQSAWDDLTLKDEIGLIMLTEAGIDLVV